MSVSKNVLWTRLGETGKDWRYVYKALAIIEYLVSHGSEHAVDDIIEHTFQILLTFSVKKRGTYNVIMFIAKNGNCNLDFGDLIAHNWDEESDNTPKSTYFSFMSRKSILIFISSTALLILAAGCMCASIWWKHFSNSSSKYQRLDIELTVSGARKLDSDDNDGWDYSWGDDWDDKEAPKTPLMSVSPSFFLKALLLGG